MLGTGAILGTAYDLRAETYDYFFPDRSWEIAGWARLARRYGARVVEWMCGTGEIACGLARRGMRVIGADLVPEMLVVAQKRAAGLPLEQRPVWIEDDVRDARLPRRDNDFSFIAAGSFGHFITREEQMDTLQTALRHLRPGGALAMTLGLSRCESYPEHQVGIFGPMRETPPGLSVRKIVSNQYDADTQLLTIHDQVQVQRGDSQRYFEYTFSIRLFTPAEIVRLLTRTGFVSVGMFGDFDLKPWRQGAPRWIVCAERPLV